MLSRLALASLLSVAMLMCQVSAQPPKKGPGGPVNPKGGPGPIHPKGGAVIIPKGGVINTLGGPVKISHLGQPNLRLKILANVPLLGPPRGVIAPVVVAAPLANPAVAAQETGLEIRELIANGAAATANLQVGHIIVMADNQRTQSFEDLTTILAKAEQPIEIVVIDPATRQLAKTSVTPTNGKIGVAVVPVEVE